MVLAERLELKPPPFDWAGGSSSVVPWMGVGSDVQGFVTRMSEELSTRSSAVPDGAGKVEMSMTRKRRRVTLAPVLFVILRRIESLPKVELFAGSEVKSRTRFGGALDGTHEK